MSERNEQRVSAEGTDAGEQLEGEAKSMRFPDIFQRTPVLTVIRQGGGQSTLVCKNAKMRKCENAKSDLNFEY
jgi:hypothetical protein